MGAAHDRGHSWGHHRRVRARSCPASPSRSAVRRCRARRRPSRTNRASTASPTWRLAPTRSRSSWPASPPRRRPASRSRSARRRKCRVQMNVSTQQETITVVAEAPVVDSATTEITTNYNREWVENAPAPPLHLLRPDQRRPGRQPAVDADQLALDVLRLGHQREPLPARRHRLHRAALAAPPGRGPTPTPSKRSQVLSLGAPAEYGNLAGRGLQHRDPPGLATRSTATRNFYYQNDALTARNTTAASQRPGRGGYPYNRDKFHDSTVQLGGPDLARTSCGSSAPSSTRRTGDSQPGIAAEFPARSNANRYFCKLNYRSTRTTGCMFAASTTTTTISRARDANTAPSAVGLNTATTRRRASPTPPCSSDDGARSPLLRASTAPPTSAAERRRRKINRRFYDLDTGNDHRRHLLLVRRQVRSRPRSPARSRKYADNFLGAQHDFKVGVQYNRAAASTLNGYNDYIYTYGGVPAYGYTQLPFWQRRPDARVGRLRRRHHPGAAASPEPRPALRLQQGLLQLVPVLDRNANEIGETVPGGRQAVRLERDLAAARRHLSS